MNIMKKLLIAIIVIMSSCEKEKFIVRNYSYPNDLSNPTSFQTGAGIHMYEGETDEDVIKRIRKFYYNGKDFSEMGRGLLLRIPRDRRAIFL